MSNDVDYISGGDIIHFLISDYCCGGLGKVICHLGHVVHGLAVSVGSMVDVIGNDNVRGLDWKFSSGILGVGADGIDASWNVPKSTINTSRHEESIWMYCSSHDRTAGTDVHPKRKRQDIDETKRKTKQLKLTDMFNTPNIPENLADTDVDPTVDGNATKTQEEIAQMAYEMIVNNDDDVPMLCVTRKKRNKKPKNHTRHYFPTIK